MKKLVNGGVADSGYALEWRCDGSISAVGTPVAIEHEQASTGERAGRREGAAVSTW